MSCASLCLLTCLSLTEYGCKNVGNKLIINQTVCNKWWHVVLNVLVASFRAQLCRSLPLCVSEGNDTHEILYKEN